jgi:hypothetical protein
MDTNGRLAVPTGAGLGVGVDMKVLAEFTTRQKDTDASKKPLLAGIFVADVERAEKASKTVKK